ncbi:MAG: hypothetical protein L6R40_004047 [Gallowayella cf. fulva]|nr:MAG: hypothetical protein L6R40_004047 [Xanthomendoza cf. fulva]
MAGYSTPDTGMGQDSFVELAADILQNCSLMHQTCQARDITPPTLQAGTTTAFWLKASTEIATTRAVTLGLLSRLTALVQGPHDFLSEFVASNWDHGSLYAILQSQTLDHIRSSGGSASLSDLSNQSGIPREKLVRILGLLRCKNIVQEPEDGVFSLTAVSEKLVDDPDFRAWIEFQLFETRVASVHLGDALSNKPNNFTDALDPGDCLIGEWFQRMTPPDRTKVVEVGGRYGFASISLAEENAELSFEVRCDSQEFLRQGEALVGRDPKPSITFTYVPSLFDPLPADDPNTVLVYVIRNLFWNWTDDDAVKLLRTLLPALRETQSTHILVTDGVSPSPAQFPPHVEIAYRRRDVTCMTMHNVKQRSQAEWLALFALVDPALQASIRSDFDKRRR